MLMVWSFGGVKTQLVQNLNFINSAFRPYGHISIIFGKYNHLRVSLLTQHLDYFINRQCSLVYRILGIIHRR
jgi:hypothetical protein